MLAEKAAMLDKVKELSYKSSLCFIFKDYLLVREREREGVDFCNHVRSLNLNWVVNKSLVLLLKNFVI